MNIKTQFEINKYGWLPRNTALSEQPFTRWPYTCQAKVNSRLPPVVGLVFESLKYPAQSCCGECLAHVKGSVLKKGRRCQFFNRVNGKIITGIYIIFYRIGCLRRSTFFEIRAGISWFFTGCGR